MEKRLLMLFMSLLIVALGNACNASGDDTQEAIGTVRHERDQVEHRHGDGDFQRLTGTNPLFNGDDLQVTQGGEGLLDFGDHLKLRLFTDSEFGDIMVESAPNAPFNARMTLERGGFTGQLTEEGSQAAFSTPGGAEITVYGTDFFVVYDEDSTQTTAGNFDGEMEVSAEGITVQVPAGNFVTVPAGSPPEAPQSPIPFSLGEFEELSREDSPIAALPLLPRTTNQTPTGTATTVQYTPSAECSVSEGLPSFISTDMTLSGDVFVTRSVTVRNNSTLTLTPGTHITICGEYQVTIGGLLHPGRLVAEGTAADPIVFQADDPAINWEGIYLGDYLEGAPTVMRYVEIHDGGGNDPTEDTAALTVSTRSTSPDFVTPEIDYLTVVDSGAHGVRVQVDDDPNPPKLNHLTITGSARAGLFIDPDAVSGLGADNIFNGNGNDRIIVLGENSSYDQHYRKQIVPYEVEDGIAWRNPGPGITATIRIDPGVTFHIPPDAGLSVGNNGAPVTLIAEGTAEDPITFTRLDDSSEPWGHLSVGGGTTADSRLAYVNLLHGGGQQEGYHPPGMLSKRHNPNLLRLDHVRIIGSTNAGIDVWDGQVIITDSIIENNRIGLYFTAGGTGEIRNSTIANNSEGGIINYWPDIACIDAIRNYWGSPDGPADEYDQADACGEANTNDGGGDSVSGGVQYEPWLDAPP